MINRQLFNALVPSGMLMKPCTGGFSLLASSANDNQIYFSPDDEVNALHPQLATVLREVAASDVYVDRGSVMCALWLLHSDVFLQDIDGEHCAIFEATHTTVTKGVLTITGRSVGYTEKFVQHAGASLKVPGLHSTQITVCPQWLALHYPDWQRQLEVAKGLGMEPLEALRTLVQGHAHAHVTGVNTPDDLVL